MLFDAALLLVGAVSAANALVPQSVNGAGSFLSTNTIDLGPAGLGGLPGQLSDLGAGEEVAVSITVETAPTAGTSVQFQLIQADDPALSTNVQVLSSTDVLPIANLTAGAQIVLKVDQTAPYPPKRYIGVRFINAGSITGFSCWGGVLKDARSSKMLFRTGWALT